jgi:hypothetical protein
MPAVGHLLSAVIVKSLQLAAFWLGTLLVAAQQCYHSAVQLDCSSGSVVIGITACSVACAKRFEHFAGKLTVSLDG